MTDRDQLELAIAAQEELRGSVPDEVIDVAVAALRERLATVGRSEARRRQVSVLFADVSGFTAMSEQLDAELVADAMNELWSRLDAVITGHGGRIDKHIGDAVMAVWGADQVREDDPERAVSAGLELHRVLAARRADTGVALAMRVGVATGPALLGAVGTTAEFTVMGDTVNVASRLEGAAPIGGMLVAPETALRVRDRFDLQRQDPVTLKGKAEPLDVHLVLGAKAAAPAFAPRFEGIESRMVGRDAELGVLSEAFERVARECDPLLVTVVAEPGAGKSRLVYELGRWLAGRCPDAARFEGQAAPATQPEAIGLFRGAIAARFGIQESDPATAVAGALRRGMDPALSSDDADVVGHWLGFDLSSSPAVQRLTAAEHFGTIAEERFVRFVRSHAPTPLVIVLEDLHWADNDSLDLIEHLLAGLTGVAALVIGTARPSFRERRPSWFGGRPDRVVCELGPLSPDSTRVLVRELLGRAGEQDLELVELISARSDGNAFFVEELLKMLIDAAVIETSGGAWRIERSRLDPGRVPSTLAGVLQARLDGLSADQRTVLQRASVVGRVFWDDAVAALGATETADTPLDPAGALAVAEERELIVRHDPSTFAGCVELMFKHGLLRDVVYDTVLLRHRRTLHALAARWLEARSGARANELATSIAEHYDHAEDLGAAATWYREAGRQAAARHAHHEAARLLARALELLAGEGGEARFDVLAELEEVHNRTGDREAQRSALAALEKLAPGVDEPRQLTYLLRRCRLAWFASELDEVARVAEEAVGRARAAGRVEDEAAALLWWGKALGWQAPNDDAEPMLQAALDRARAAGQPSLAGQALRFLAIVANNAGRYDDAIAFLDAARDEHRSAADLDGESEVVGQLGSILFNRGDHEEARNATEASRVLCQQSGYRYGEAVNTMNLAITDIALGRLAGARELLEHGLALSAAIEDQEGIAFGYNSLGELYRGVGDWLGAAGALSHSIESGRALGSDVVVADSMALLALVELAEGHLATATTLAEEGLVLARSAAVPLVESRALVAEGYAFRATGRLEEARDAFEAAGALHEQLGLAERAGLESRTGLASVLLRLGRHEEAHRVIVAVLPRLDAAALQGALVPGEVLLGCHGVLTEVGDGRAADVAELATAWLRDRAEQIDDRELRAGFLEDVPVHRVLRRLGGKQ
jgi:class 3 adenylate cyclase/tetratricopeptide (TPR) repeat protein